MPLRTFSPSDSPPNALHSPPKAEKKRDWGSQDREGRKHIRGCTKAGTQGTGCFLAFLIPRQRTICTLLSPFISSTQQTQVLLFPPSLTRRLHFASGIFPLFSRPGIFFQGPQNISAAAPLLVREHRTREEQISQHLPPGIFFLHKLLLVLLSLEIPAGVHVPTLPHTHPRNQQAPRPRLQKS